MYSFINKQTVKLLRYLEYNTELYPMVPLQFWTFVGSCLSFLLIIPRFSIMCNCSNCNSVINHHHHHHHIVLAARISLTLSRHSSLSFIALGRSSGQQPVSSHSCWMYVRAGRPAFARPCVGIHKSTSLMSSSLLLQQCPACLVRASNQPKRTSKRG